jgi:hypothetical protein
VIANHVFHYFSSLEYAEQNFVKMLKKSNKIVFLSGIPNLLTKDASEFNRRGILSKVEYEKKYNGLEILYFDKFFFTNIASKYLFSVIFFPHKMPNFAQNEYRFDTVFTSYK